MAAVWSLTVLLTVNYVFTPSICNSNIYKHPKRQEILPVCGDVGCQQGIDAGVDYTTALHSEQATEISNLRERVRIVEDDLYSSISTINDLVARVSNLEFYLPGNVTVLNNRITDEVRGAIDLSILEVEAVRLQLTNRLNDLATDVDIIKNNQNTGGGGNQNAALDVYVNVTRRIDSLEFGRIANLTADNGIWRRNFRVVNSTFERMKVSGNCVCK